MRAMSRCDSCDKKTLRFVCPSCTRDMEGIAAKLWRCGIASEALRRNMPLRERQDLPECIQHNDQNVSPKARRLSDKMLTKKFALGCEMMEEVSDHFAKATPSVPAALFLRS